jgi:Peptidase family M28
VVKNRDCIHQPPSDRERLTIASIRYSTRMFVRIARPMAFLVVATLCPLSSWVVVFAATVHYSPASRQVIEERLRKYAGDNKQREATLKQMFADVGCNDQHLSEQSVKGSKLPNIVCLLPGTSDKVILVGAHYDRVSDGDGVVDNWSGASLLPSPMRR